MKILQILALLFFLTSFVKAQACGPAYLTIFVTDSNGETVRNVKFQFFDENFKNEDDYYHRGLPWSEEKHAYHSVVGFGGNGRTGLRISAEGFENFDKVISLPIGWITYAVKLKRIGTDEISEAAKLNRIDGQVSDLAKTGISKAGIIAVNENNEIIKTASGSNGHYEIFLRDGNYRFEVFADGFKKAVGQNIIVSGRDTLDFNLEINEDDSARFFDKCFDVFPIYELQNNGFSEISDFKFEIAGR